MTTNMFPDNISFKLIKQDDLRYGENPHQKSALYKIEGEESKFKKIHGLKELSYNNIIDIESAWNCVDEFEQPAVVIIKHTNPCGAALGEDPIDAYRKALSCDARSAFGSIIASNKEVTSFFVEELKDLFIEALVAPSFTNEALAILMRKKKNCRVVKVNPEIKNNLNIISTSSGLLLQTPDNTESSEDWTVVTETQPEDQQLRDLDFAWKIAKHCKSNAIVLVKDEATIGIGCGQMSRIDALDLALTKAWTPYIVNPSIFNAVMASDAFFPFPDCIEKAAGHNIIACVQPGGSIKDKDSIEVADKHSMSMIFTGRRHFRH